MEVLIKIFVLGFVVLGVRSSMIQLSGFDLPAIDAWWGPEELQDEQDTSIRPFEIKFEEKMVTDLLYRLKNHRQVTPPLEGAGFTYGFNTDQMQSWVDYWAESYNFTAREAYFNQFPHYKTNIQGLDMHFIHVKPEGCNLTVVPLMMLHGWPGSIREFYKAIPLLTACNEELGFAVEVIVPSLPGFGFSDGAVRQGLGGSEMAVILRNLMHRLGFEKFYIQGGDWGALISNSIATLFPDEVLGFHNNFALTLTPGALATWLFGSLSELLQPLVVESSIADRLYPLLTIVKGLMSETGYLHLQATKPDSIGVALSDSPSGLAAYFLQMVSLNIASYCKYKDNGCIDDVFTRDEMIDNLMMYWAPNCITTASRIYAETFNTRNVNMKVFALPATPPVWSFHTKYEVVYQSPAMLRHKFPNLINSTVIDHGGHHLALELPEEYSENVLTALAAFMKWHEDKNKKIACDEL